MPEYKCDLCGEVTDFTIGDEVILPCTKKKTKPCVGATPVQEQKKEGKNASGNKT